MFDNAEHKGVSLAASADRLIGFGHSKHEGERLRHLDLAGGFFVPCFHQLVGWVREAKACWVYLCDQLSNLHSACLFRLDTELASNHKEALS